MKQHEKNCDCFECAIDPNGYIAHLNQNILMKPNNIDPSGRYLDDFEKDFSNVIKWNSEPLLANPLTFWKDWWNAKTWIKWHSLVKEKYGKDRANEVFIEWFKKAVFASPTTDFRTFDKDFIAYAKANGFYDALFSGVGGFVGKTAGTLSKTVDTATKIVGKSGDIVESAGVAVEKSTDLIGGIFKNMNYIIIVVILIALFIGYVQLNKALK